MEGLGSARLGSGGASAIVLLLPLMLARARNLSSTQQKPYPLSEKPDAVAAASTGSEIFIRPDPEIPRRPLPSLASSSSRLHPPKGAGESVQCTHAAISSLCCIWVWLVGGDGALLVFYEGFAGD